MCWMRVVPDDTRRHYTFIDASLSAVEDDHYLKLTGSASTIKRSWCTSLILDYRRNIGTPIHARNIPSDNGVGFTGTTMWVSFVCMSDKLRIGLGCVNLVRYAEDRLALGTGPVGHSGRM